VISTPKGIYLVLDKVQGRQLFQVLNDHGALPIALARALTRQLLQALALLHSYGVVHRDVKPENLMVNFHDAPHNIDPAAVHLFLIDFGWAGTTDTPFAATLTGLAGSPGYCAAEVLMWNDDDEDGGLRADERIPPYSSACDIFSTGVTTFVMISAEMPYSDIDDPSTKQILFESEAWQSAALASAKTFVRSLLTVSPAQRPTAEKALQLDFLMEVPDERQSGKGRLLREKQRQSAATSPSCTPTKTNGDDVSITIGGCNTCTPRFELNTPGVVSSTGARANNARSSHAEGSVSLGISGPVELAPVQLVMPGGKPAQQQFVLVISKRVAMWLGVLIGVAVSFGCGLAVGMNL